MLKFFKKMLELSALVIGVMLGVSSSLQEPIVNVKQGRLKGSILNLLDGSPYFSFKGIPYAEPPVGKLRFQAPRPPKPWSGIRSATTHGPNCPQFDVLTNQYIEGNEDCLFLNVYTKSLTTRKPVMVYIHGGAYMSGSGDTDTYGPEFILQHDVILVTINYRLEVLGFLCLDIPEAPGNAGMKDQVAALKWVKENIAKFGGDPDNITIFGESAGSGSVTFHMVSPMSRGLFNKAIAQSGVCIQDWSNTSEAQERAFRVGKYLGKDTRDPYELLEFLRDLPALNLTKLTHKTATADEKFRGLPVHFVPVVEKKFNNVEAFIDEEPVNLVIGNKHNVPLLIGYNSAEGILMVQDQLKKSKTMNDNPHYFVPKEITKKVSETKQKEFGRRIKEFYVKVKEYGNDTVQAIVDLQTDLHFAYNTHRFIHLYNKCNAPIYMYVFDYATDMNILKKFMGIDNVSGACHADDLYYLFYNEFNKDPYREQERIRKIIYDYTKLWADFAKTGNPTPNTMLWKPFTPSQKEYLNLNEKLISGKYADRERMEFWNKLYQEAGIPYITHSSL